MCAGSIQNPKIHIDDIRAASARTTHILSRDSSRRPSSYLDRAFGLGAPQTDSVIKSEDFEGEFPNDWLTFDDNAETGGEVFWSADSFRSNGGSFSAWSAGGGTDRVAGGSDYPNDLDSWLYFGPFDLSDAVSARMDFSLWLDSEVNHDFISWMASSDGENFNGYQMSGTTEGWTAFSFNLANVSMLGQTDVYIAFIMESDSEGTAGGAYIDDVTISKEVPEADIEVWPLTITIDNESETPAESITATESSRPYSSQAEKLEIAAKLEQQMGAKDKVDVIVGLEMNYRPEGKLSPAAKRQQRTDIQASQSRLLLDLTGLGASEKRRFQSIPYMALRVNERALQALANNPRVSSIESDSLSRPLMDSSNPVIGSPLAWADGWDGSGYAVAVLDTGVDSTHPWLTGKVSSEACYSTSEDGVSESLCPEAASNSTDPGSGLHCSGVSGCDHGTHVAGTVAGNDGVGPGFGVARDADVVAMQVFTKFLDDEQCGTGESPCVLTYSSDQIAALERVLVLSATMDIASVNMSLGGGQYFDQTTCDDNNNARKAAIDALLSVGIATVISSGNNDYRDSVGAPGCISTAVTVGATTDDDLIASFSNVADFVDLVAPGVSIVSSIPGGGTASFQGTSMAAPHVAGAFSVLREYTPNAPVGDLLKALRTTGTPVDDNRSSGTVTALPRINVYQAIQVLAASRQSLFIRNNGSSDLQVSSIHADPASAWLSFNPAAPFTVPQGQLKSVELAVDFSSAPYGTTKVDLVIESNDPDESPYPGGVALTVINVSTCNLTSVSGVSINSETSYDACETIVVGPSFVAETGANVSLSAGSEVEILPEFRIGVGATLDTQVCGQSLCASHDEPMPYGCHSCVNQICIIAPTCCNTSFDQSCLDMVETTCGLACDP